MSARVSSGGPGASASGETAVDKHTMAGDKRRPTGAESQNGLRHLLDPTDTPDRMEGGKVVFCCLHACGEPVGHRGVDHPGVDRAR